MVQRKISAARLRTANSDDTGHTPRKLPRLASNLPLQRIRMRLRTHAQLIYQRRKQKSRKIFVQNVEIFTVFLCNLFNRVPGFFLPAARCHLNYNKVYELWKKKEEPDCASSSLWWGKVDSNHRRHRQQIYSLSPLATREFPHILFLMELVDGLEPTRGISPTDFESVTSTIPSHRRVRTV